MASLWAVAVRCLAQVRPQHSKDSEGCRVSESRLQINADAPDLKLRSSHLAYQRDFHTKLNVSMLALAQVLVLLHLVAVALVGTVMVPRLVAALTGLRWSAGAVAVGPVLLGATTTTS